MDLSMDLSAEGSMGPSSCDSLMSSPRIGSIFGTTENSTKQGCSTPLSSGIARFGFPPSPSLICLLLAKPSGSKKCSKSSDPKKKSKSASKKPSQSASPARVTLPTTSPVTVAQSKHLLAASGNRDSGSTSSFISANHPHPSTPLSSSLAVTATQLLTPPSQVRSSPAPQSQPPLSQGTSAPSPSSGTNIVSSAVSGALTFVKRFFYFPIGAAELKDVSDVAKLVIGEELSHTEYGRTEVEVEHKVKHGRIEKVMVRRSVRIQNKTKPVYLLKFH